MYDNSPNPKEAKEMVRWYFALMMYAQTFSFAYSLGINRT
jgi:hypothetical protein